MGFLNYVWELVYPSRCPLCGKISQGICPECRRTMKVIKEPYCFSCGKQLQLPSEEYCDDCRKKKHKYVRGRALFRYEGREKEMIHKIKYENKREYLPVLAELLAEKMQKEIMRWQVDVCIPIPMYERRKRKRGFNQSEILANCLGKILQLPVSLQLLEKRKDTGEQKKLSAKERVENLKAAFTARSCKDLRILLVDDVYTTGSTMDAASEVLMEAGAEAVFFVCVCAGNGNN